MLDANLTQQLQTYLANLREPIELVASLDDGEVSAKSYPRTWRECRYH